MINSIYIVSNNNILKARNGPEHYRTCIKRIDFPKILDLNSFLENNTALDRGTCLTCNSPDKS